MIEQFTKVKSLDLGFSSSAETKRKQDTTKQSGEVLFSTPCSGPEFYKSSDYFRASNFGESSDHVIAKKKALSNARASLASSVNTTIKSVVDNYLKASEFNNIEETEERYESLSR